MRRSLRIPFIAVAQIAYSESDGHLSCQVATLSLHGCYVETPNTLPVAPEFTVVGLCEDAVLISL